jgi:hypothetical protein
MVNIYRVVVDRVREEHGMVPLQQAQLPLEHRNETQVDRLVHGEHRQFRIAPGAADIPTRLHLLDVQANVDFTILMRYDYDAEVLCLSAFAVVLAVVVRPKREVHDVRRIAALAVRECSRSGL